MESILMVVVLVLVVGLVVTTFFLVKRTRPSDPPKADDSGIKFLLEEMHELSRIVDRKVGDLTETVGDKMRESSRTMTETMRQQFDSSQKIVTDVIERLTKLDETNRQVVSFADQLQNLQDILKNPKQRGILGEYYLETLLKNTMPPGQYQMQYKFPKREGDLSDVIVDAAVFVKDKIIPIDSKFSLENYNRLAEEKNTAEREKLEKAFVNDLKNRIQETAKYVRPNDGTMDFAFMFIPHEAIYYDLLVNKIGSITEETDNLIRRAASKYKVIIVSPTSFSAYLQTVLQALNALRIEETAKQIILWVGDLGRHLKKYEDYHLKLGNQLSTVVNHYNSSGKEFKKIDKDVMRITGTAPGIDVAAIEGPEVEE